MQKLNSVQYLRAVAVLLIIVFHCSIRLSNSLPRDAIDFLRVGSAGVDLFFVVSGFIMWVIGERRPTSPHHFVLRRLIRIVPTYWLFTLLWTVAALVGVFAWVEVTPSHVLLSLFFVPHFAEGKPYPILVPGWTLNYEMFFYLVFAICLSLKANARIIALCAILGLLVATGYGIKSDSTIVRTYTNPLLLEFMAGSVAGYLWQRNLLPKGAGAVVLFALGIGGLVVAGLVGIDEERSRVWAWGIPALMLFVGTLGIARFEGQRRWLLAIGDASYSIYLAHIFPIVVLNLIYGRVPMLDTTLAGAALYFVICIASALGGGLLTYRLFEHPFESYLGRRLIPRVAHAARPPDRSAATAVGLSPRSRAAVSTGARSTAPARRS